MQGLGCMRLAGRPGSLIRLARGRAGLLAVDQVLSGASNLLVLGVAGYLLAPGELSGFALLQAFVLAAVSLQRAYLEGGLAAQRRSGRTVVPFGWIPRLGLPLGLGAGLVASVAAESSLGFSERLVFVALIGTPFVLAQDLSRYCQISRANWRALLASDAAWLVVSTVAAAFWARGATVMFGAWTAGAAISLGVSIGLSRRRADHALAFENPATHRSTWPVARWTLADATIGQLGTLAPLLFAQAYSASAILGAFRLLQSSLAPINTAYNVMSLSLLSDAHVFVGAKGERLMRTRIRRLTLLYSLGALAYCILTFTCLWYVVGRRLLPAMQYLEMVLIITAVAVAGGAIGPRIVGARMSRRPGLSALPRTSSLLGSMAFLGLLMLVDLADLPMAVPLSVLTGTVCSILTWLILASRPALQQDLGFRPTVALPNQDHAILGRDEEKAE